MQIDGQTYYTAAETAERLSIAATTLRRQRQNGRITGRQIGRDWIYSEAAIQGYQTGIQANAGARSHANRPAPPPRGRSAGARR